MLRVSFKLFFLQAMAKNLRQNVQASHRGAGTHKKKVGVKKKTGGKQRLSDRDKACEARKAAAWASTATSTTRRAKR
jgi:hypothetical protein